MFSSARPVSRKGGRLAFCGIAGCVLMALGDYLMIYGDTAYSGALPWLTAGAALIPAQRNAAAMALALPAVLLYAVALLGLKNTLPDRRDQSLWIHLNTFGMIPWLCLHLFYSMILFLFGWLGQNGFQRAMYLAPEALFTQFSWVVIAGEFLMVLPFLCFSWLCFTGRTAFAPAMAFNNPLLIYLVLKLLTLVLPDCPARLAFVNGLMSESMAIWFLLLYLGQKRR